MSDALGSLRWIDNHCHLADDANEVLDQARRAGVLRFIDVGCDLGTSEAAIEHARRHDGVFTTVGLHPHEARNGLAGLEALLGAEPVVAVGECGLDYHYDHSPRPTQREMFATQIGWAHQYELPLVIHTREAWQETFEILDREGVPERTIFHCFTGGAPEAFECLARGAFLSFSGIVSFKNAEDVRDAVRACPSDRLLVETDSPYLAPVPHRGETNQPAWVARVGEVVAEVRGAEVGEVARMTWANAHRAYPRLGSPE